MLRRARLARRCGVRYGDLSRPAARLRLGQAEPQKLALTRARWTAESLLAATRPPAAEPLRVGHALQQRRCHAASSDDFESNDPYRVLGVERDATDKELKRAYLRQAKEHHPDMRPNDALAKKRFQAIAEAYELLRDPGRRAHFDATGRRQSTPGTPGQDAGHQSAEELFRRFSQDSEVVVEAVRLYAEAVVEELQLAAELIWQGRWSEAWPIIREHRALFAVVGVLSLLLRFPAAAALAVRFGLLGGAQLLQQMARVGPDRRVWASLWQHVWGHFVAAAHRQRARLRQRAKERHGKRPASQPPKVGASRPAPEEPQAREPPAREPQAKPREPPAKPRTKSGVRLRR